MNDNTFGLMTFEGLSIALVGIVTVMHECTLSMYNCTAHLKMFDQAFTSAYLHKEYFWPKAKERDKLFIHLGQTKSRAASSTLLFISTLYASMA